MNNGKYNAIGIVEASFYANAVVLLDAMTKAAQVDFLAAEKLLGGRLVTLVVGGTTSEVNAAVEAARAAGEVMHENPVKVAITISNPHPEIMKYVLKA
jgi:microcompartment protein CcmL/EutN